jgi:hypothetical protein
MPRQLNAAHYRTRLSHGVNRRLGPAGHQSSNSILNGQSAGWYQALVLGEATDCEQPRLRGLSTISPGWGRNEIENNRDVSLYILVHGTPHVVAHVVTIERPYLQKSGHIRRSVS